MLGELTPRQMSNLKVLASTMFYVSRRTAGLNSQILVKKKRMTNQSILIDLSIRLDTSTRMGIVTLQ